MSSKDNVQERILVFGELEKSLLDKVISHSTKEGASDLSNLFCGQVSIEGDDLTENTREIFRLLAGVASMRLTPENRSEPFKALVYMADGQRSTLPCDFSVNDLDLLATIFETVSYAPLLARIGDVLWFCNKPRKPVHAKKAIDCYISQKIEDQTWHGNGKKEFHRAYQLARYINSANHISKIETLLKNAFLSKDDIALFVAQLIDNLFILQDSHVEIATRLEKLGDKLLSEGKPESAVRFFQLASKKYNQGSDTSKCILMLVRVAECYEVDAESKFSLGGGAKLISNSFFEAAIHAYRKIPTEYREEYSVEQKISALKFKLNEAGRHTLDQMGIIKTPLGEADEMIRLSREHVSGKTSEFEAIIFFSGVWNVPDYKEMMKREEKSMSSNYFSSLFASCQYSSDGRVVARTPAIGLDDSKASYEAVLNDNMIRSFSREMAIVVQTAIIPALQKISEEHTIGTHFVFEICDSSPIVPKENVNLIARAILLGFEFDFSTAVHLVAPQMEKIIRMLIKNQGGHTTNIDKDSIEHENGLGSLLAMTEASSILGEDVLFELKAVFSNPIGANLRNEVAHGLITDGVAYSSASPVIYAWWVLVRMVVHSLITPIRENASDSV